MNGDLLSTAEEIGEREERVSHLRQDAPRLMLRRLRTDASLAQAHTVPGPWRLLAWVGSLGLGLALYLIVARRLHIPAHSFQDIVATPAFENHAELQDLALYLLGLVLVPLAMAAGYALWLGLVALLTDNGHSVARYAAPLATLVLLVPWLWVLAWGPPALVSAFVLAGVVLLIVQGLEVARPHLARRLPPAAGLPSPALHGAVALIGLGLGVALLVGPRPVSPFALPALDVGACAAGLWATWLAVSYGLARAWQKEWRTVGLALALACLPLSLCFVRGLLWWEVWQAGTRVASHGSPWGPALLGAVALGGVGVVAWVTLAAVRRGREVQGRLAPAQALMNGQVAYRDIVFVHGFGRDPGVALLAFRLMGVSVESLRVVEHWLAPLALVASYYLVLVSIGGGWALAYSFLVLTGFFPIYYGWWIVPTMAALTCLVLGAQRPSEPRWPLAAGLLTFLGLAVSYDLGGVALVSGLAMGLSLALFRWHRFGLRPLLAYVLPLAAGTLGLWLWAGQAGAWEPLLAWHAQILAVYRDWNGMPFPASATSLAELVERFLSPLVSVLALVGLLMAAVRNKWQSWTSAVLVLLVANVTLFNRGVVGGYEQGSALFTASHFGPILALQLGSFPAARRRVGTALAVVVALTVFVPPARLSLVERSPGQLLAGLHLRNRAVVPEAWVRSGVQRIGDLYLPREQEQSLAEITALLQGSTFWDQTDHGLLYFLSDGASPSRFYATHHVITGENQRQVIHDLSKNPPERVLYRSGTGWDAIAGVDRSLRSYLVSEYLLRNYHLTAQVGGLTVLEPSPVLPSDPPLEFPVNLGYVPLLWGQDRLGDLQALGPVKEIAWSFESASDVEEWQAGGSGLVASVDKEGWHLRTAGDGASLENSTLLVDPKRVTYLALRLAADASCAGPLQARLYWRTAAGDLAEARSAVFRLQGDGQEHLYLVRLASLPAWTWSRPIRGLRVDLTGCPTLDVTLRSVELFRVQEW
jgi:hypothetical protein